jgi:hypothetical protein
MLNRLGLLLIILTGINKRLLRSVGGAPVLTSRALHFITRIEKGGKYRK